ncbi:hypothetical protein DFP72DRAFT_859526 [Ephemerocybe angulata]|uniref:Uncharacterized protein n=1 Tax=Ephemerocybe angulata TaxID=980116 RepID=A0A8H6HCA1_9AGAR|nr:hypothetical protein DFP72DRAFT_859526 [Tulosesus angulatus]
MSIIGCFDSRVDQGVSIVVITNPPGSGHVNAVYTCCCVAQHNTSKDSQRRWMNGQSSVCAIVPVPLPLFQRSPLELGVLMEADEAMETSEDDIEDIRATSAVPPTPAPTLPSPPMHTSSPLTLSQCFLPPSSPYTSPPPCSVPSPPASPPIDLPRLTRASKRLYIHALESVPALDSIEPTPLDGGECITASEASTATSYPAPVQPLAESRTSLNENIQSVSVPKAKARIRAQAKDPTPATKKSKKLARHLTKTTIVPPKSSKPSCKRPKITRPPPPLAPRPSASRSPPATLPPCSQLPSSRVQADIDVDDPIPTAADLERALYEGITFTPCVDISLSAVPFRFGLEVCGFQFGHGGGSGLGGLGSELELGVASVDALGGDSARAWVDAPAPADDVNGSGMING